MPDLVIEDTLELDTRVLVDPTLDLRMGPSLIRERARIFSVTTNDAGIAAITTSRVKTTSVPWEPTYLYMHLAMVSRLTASSLIRRIASIVNSGNG